MSNAPPVDLSVHHKAHGWNLAADATLRDVVLVVRADEAHHRDVNHGFADELAGATAGERAVSPYPEHAAELQPAADPPPVPAAIRAA